MSIILLTLSIVLGTVRNLLSKNISELSFGTKRFFFSQATIFFAGGIALGLLSGNYANVSKLTICYSIIYGVLLLLAQWCYTAALKNGKIGVCSTVYSLGFIFPTVAGSLIWNEAMTFFDIVGVLTVIPAIIVSGINKKSEFKNVPSNNYIVPLIIAMMSSGGLGIMQKVQQHSQYPEQRAAFVVLAFVFAGIVSFICSLFIKSDSEKTSSRKIYAAAGVGVAFGCCNLLNTTLAGLLDSAVLFPVLNIGTILFSILMGILFFKERLKFKDVSVLLLGIISILLISCG